MGVAVTDASNCGRGFRIRSCLKAERILRLMIEKAYILMSAQKKVRGMNEKTVIENTYVVMSRVLREMLMLKVFLVKLRRK